LIEKCPRREKDDCNRYGVADQERYHRLVSIQPAVVSVVVPKHAGGRPTGYDPKTHPQLAAILASRGTTVAEFADAVGMTDRTVRNRFRNYPEFADAFKFAASAFDERVERALAERAIGYEVDSEEIRVVDGKLLHIPVRRQFPPDVGAATLYLTNRMPHKYKRMVDVHTTGDKIESTEVIVEEIQTKILRLAAKYRVALPGLRLKEKQNGSGSEGDGGAGSSGG
jgi:AcrR family transcriptional regulator